MKVFVVNLDRRPDRLVSISGAMNSLGLVWERISAVDGRAIHYKNYARWTLSRIYHGFEAPPIGAVGCFLSHKIIWQRMVDEDIKQALVFEDDAIPVDFDAKIMSVDISEYGLDVLRLCASSTSHQKLSKKPFAHLLGRGLVDETTASTASYIVTKVGAEKMLRLEKFWFPIDAYDVWKKLFNVKSAIINPVMFSFLMSGSDIYDSTQNSVFKNNFKGIYKRYMRYSRLLAIGIFKLSV